MAIIAGQLRHTITIQALTISKNTGYGSATTSYAPIMTVRTAVQYGAGGKGINASEIFNSQAVQFTTYYRPAIVETCRIIFNEKTYIINNIAEIGYKEGMIITAELLNE